MAGHRGVRHLPLKIVLLLVLCLLPGVGLAHGLSSGAGWAGVLLALYGLASMVSLVLYGHDKRQARRQGQRVPERWLHLSEACGGWPGALLAQQLWRHKTRKLSFQAVFWGIVLVHQALWCVPLLVARG